MVSASNLGCYSDPHTQLFPSPPSSTDKIDELLRQTGIEAPEFGTIVHSFIEAIFNGEEPKLSSRYSASLGIKNQKALTEAALALANGFFDSPLGCKAVSAGFRRTEYPILTAVQVPQYTQGTPHKVIVSGRIDLLFDNGSSMYVVDFKTDKDEDITRYAGQLAVYKRAVEDIFGKTVECRLFYLRSGHEADLNEAISNISPEELVLESLR